jgi:hypothetical protein
MKRNLIVTSLASWLVLMLVTSYGSIAQNTAVTWYAVDAGFGVLSSSNTVVKSAVGQSFVGRGQQANTVIESGFLADTLFRRLLTGIGGPPEIPTVYELRQNYPNPFNPITTISYDLPRQSHVTLVVYDILGRETVRLVDEIQEPGSQSIVWNGRIADGSAASSGVYFYRLEAHAKEHDHRFAEVRKLMLLR